MLLIKQKIQNAKDSKAIGNTVELLSFEINRVNSLIDHFENLYQMYKLSYEMEMKRKWVKFELNSYDREKFIFYSKIIGSLKKYKRNIMIHLDSKELELLNQKTDII